MADVTNQASYASSNEEVATVNSEGTVTGISAGTTTVTVTFEDKEATVEVTVEEPEPELQSIDVEPQNVTISEGDTQNLTVTANYE